MKKYALQTLFSYGWDYVGSDENGDRLLFDKFSEAIAEAKEAKRLSGGDWRPVEYNPANDTKSDL